MWLDWWRILGVVTKPFKGVLGRRRVVPYREQSRVLILGQETDASQGFAVPRFCRFSTALFCRVLYYVPVYVGFRR